MPDVEQSLAADGATAYFSSNLFLLNLDADRAPQLKAVVRPPLELVYESFILDYQLDRAGSRHLQALHKPSRKKIPELSTRLLLPTMTRFAKYERLINGITLL
jgi:hypothetical protein